MKINYKPNGGGPAKRNPPKQWEVWLADAPFGAEGKKRCPVLVGKRGGMSYAVYDPEERRVTLRRLPFDFPGYIANLQSAGVTLPRWLR